MYILYKCDTFKLALIWLANKLTLDTLYARFIISHNLKRISISYLLISFISCNQNKINIF